MWCLPCFKPSTKHDPIEERFEDVIKCKTSLEDDQFNWAIQESFNAQEPFREAEDESLRTRQLENDKQVAYGFEYGEETEVERSVVNEEDEQLSRLVEEDLKEKGKKKQDEDDQKVAMMIQESLYLVEPHLSRADERKSIVINDEDEQRVILESFKGKGQIKQSKDEVEEDGRLPKAKLDVNPPHRKCDGCNSAIEDGSSVNVLGGVWHPECFCCLYCHKQIAMHEFYSKGKFHRSCYKDHRHPNCYVCEKKIPATAEGIKYNEHSFWKEKYCPCHEVDETPKCCSCERLEPCGSKYVLLADNRWLCVQCMECAVMDTDECISLHIDVREFFDGLNMKIEKEFPLFLVEKEALNKAEKEEKIDNQLGIVTRGICLSEAQKVDSVSKGPKMGPNEQLVGITTESQSLIRECEVTAILILYGLPRLLTGYILAHEMMHAWLRLKGYRDLKLELEEGLCQVLAYMWLDSQSYSITAAASSSASASSSSSHAQAASTSKKGAQFDFEKKLVEFCKNQIETDESPVYGLGFKQVNHMVSNSNLQEILRQIPRSTSNTKPNSNR